MENNYSYRNEFGMINEESLTLFIDKGKYSFELGLIKKIKIKKTRNYWFNLFCLALSALFSMLLLLPDIHPIMYLIIIFGATVMLIYSILIKKSLYEIHIIGHTKKKKIRFNKKNLGDAKQLIGLFNHKMEQ